MGIRVAPASVTSQDRCGHKMLDRTPGLSASDILSTITINVVIVAILIIAIIIVDPLATPTSWDNQGPSLDCRLLPADCVDRASHSLIKLFTFPP